MKINRRSFLRLVTVAIPAISIGALNPRLIFAAKKHEVIPKPKPLSFPKRRMFNPNVRLRHAVRIRLPGTYTRAGIERAHKEGEKLITSWVKDNPHRNIPRRYQKQFKFYSETDYQGRYLFVVADRDPKRFL